VWLCRPSLAHNPCTAKLTMTSIGPDGVRSVESASPAAPSGLDCFYVYPAALGGGTGALDPELVRAEVPGLTPAPSTLWVTFPGLYTARCEHVGDVTWLQVDHASGTGRPIVAPTPEPGFGYHGNDMTLTMGNLLEDVAAAEATARLSR